MREIASRGQLRLAFLRWAIVTVPFVLLLGFTSARLVPVGSSNAWYAALLKPPQTPPDWAFPVAWTAIYVLMGLSLAMIVNARGSRLRGTAIALFAVQLIANLIWSPLFFGAHKVSLALALIVVMFVLTAATAHVFARIRRVAGWLLVPYLAWLLFAGFLTYRIGQLNPDAESLVPRSATTQIAL